VAADEIWPDGRRVTLEDVAARAGVSRALVSIVMRGAPGASEESRDRVVAAAEELGYRPDIRARALAGSRSNMIGVLMTDAGHFHFDIVDGLYPAAEKHRCNLALSAVTPRRDEKIAVESFADFHIDALVMLGPSVARPLLTGLLPLVVVGWHVDQPEVDIVRTSDEHALALAVDHLVDLGHRKIVYFQGGSDLIPEARARAYAAAMARRGLDTEIAFFNGGSENMLGGQRAARMMLDAGGPLPTAVITHNDEFAAAAKAVFNQAHLDVPGDISIVGYDNSALARSPGVDVTSITQDAEEMGRLAVERIMERTAGIPVHEREIVLEPELAIRSSTGPARSQKT